VGAVLSSEFKFLALVVASCLVFCGILLYVTRARSNRLNMVMVAVVTLAVVPGGMLLARYGAQSVLPWWIYYTVPMLLTVFMPPVVFSMTRHEAIRYVVLAFLSAPVIHVLFSFFLGWTEYMPFLRVPSLWDLAGAA